MMLRHENDVEKRIVEDLKYHVVTVLLDGVTSKAGNKYLHYRCQKPGTWINGFDVVVWPGSMCYTGDMGDFLFQRTPDMIGFMRTAVRDVSYCASKCVAGKDEIKEWSEDRFHEHLAERLKDGSEYTVMRRGGYHTESVQKAIDGIKRSYAEYGLRSDAEKAMYESGLWDGTDLPSCEIYTTRFLWCLHALRWLINIIDSPVAKIATTVPTSGESAAPMTSVLVPGVPATATKIKEVVALNRPDSYEGDLKALKYAEAMVAESYKGIIGGVESIIGTPFKSVKGNQIGKVTAVRIDEKGRVYAKIAMDK